MFAIDLIIGAGTAFATTYSIIILRKMNDFSRLETGIGKAIAVFSAQVDELKSTLDNATQSGNLSTNRLQNLLERAEKSEKNLEIILASFQDLTMNPENQEPPEISLHTRNRIRKQHPRAAE